MKVTPYGFVLLNMFFDGDTFTTRDYPGAVAATNAGGAVLGSARQSRFGVRLAGKDSQVTGADLSGVIEFDFKAGHLPTVNATTGLSTAPASTAWYNGVMRLRLAAATASWKTPYGTWSLLAGQEYGLVNPLFAESLAWVADPLFWQAGNLWRRSPQVRGTFAGNFGGVGLTIAAAALSPADGVSGAPYSTDFGPGNRSRTPDLEGRVALSYKASPELFGTVGVAYDAGTRRLPGAATGTVKDVDVNSLGVDVDLNLPYVQVKGEWYQNEGEDDVYNGIITPGIVGAVATTGYKAVNTDGYWAQAILKPIPAIWVTVGYGEGNSEKKDLAAAFGAAPTAGQLATRTKSTQMEVGLLLNAGKFWRVGLEAIKVETTSFGPLVFNGTKNKDDATQIAFSSQLKF